MKNDNFKIIVACHKADPLVRSDELYLPVQVGKALTDIELGFQGDNDGDNISDKNRSYCELTALYWAWKNLPDIAYIGLAHYRRYLSVEFANCELKDIFSKVDFLIPYERVLPISNLSHLQELLSAEDVCIMLDSLIELYPEMTQSVLDYFYNSNRYSLFNMFVTTRASLDAYCSFLFPLLGYIEKRLGYHSYSRLTRSIGYMAEAILGLWLLHNRLRVKRVYCEFDGRRMTLSLKNRIKQYKDRLAFRLAKTRKSRIPCFYAAVINALNADGVAIRNLKAYN